MALQYVAYLMFNERFINCTQLHLVQIIYSLFKFFNNVFLDCLTLKMDAILISETSVTVYMFIQYNIPEDLNLQ